MHRAATALLVVALTLFMWAGISLAQTLSTGPIAPPVLLTAEFHAGETVRYTFQQEMTLSTRVDPGVPADRVSNFTPRQYQVEGEILAKFASTAVGEPLRGTVQFQGLKVKNWASSANVADLEACLRQLESTTASVTTAADGSLRLGEMPAQLVRNRFALDVEDLYSLAQAVLISRMATDRLTPGQDRESTDFPVPGLVKPGLNMTVRTEYLANIPVAGQPSAEVRLSMHVPNQSRLVSSEPDVSNTFERLYALGDWTYLLDLGAHQISFLRKTVRTETGYSVESADSNEAIRIPRNLFTVEKQYQVTARRVLEGESPQRVADLAAFEKSLTAAHAVLSNGSGAPASAVPLGDVVRRLREGQQAPSPGQDQTAPPDHK
jgi:hypothetical protein